MEAAYMMIPRCAWRHMVSVKLEKASTLDVEGITMPESNDAGGRMLQGTRKMCCPISLTSHHLNGDAQRTRTYLSFRMALTMRSLWVLMGRNTTA